jgi:hypothetical protein
MALRLDDPEIDRLAYELAALEGCPVGEAVCRAVLARIWAMPVLDPRDHTEMLYDGDGLPR